MFRVVVNDMELTSVGIDSEVVREVVDYCDLQRLNEFSAVINY